MTFWNEILEVKRDDNFGLPYERNYTHVSYVLTRRNRKGKVICSFTSGWGRYLLAESSAQRTKRLIIITFYIWAATDPLLSLSFNHGTLRSACTQQIRQMAQQRWNEKWREDCKNLKVQQDENYHSTGGLAALITSCYTGFALDTHHVPGSHMSRSRSGVSTGIRSVSRPCQWINHTTTAILLQCITKARARKVGPKYYRNIRNRKACTTLAQSIAVTFGKVISPYYKGGYGKETVRHFFLECRRFKN